MSMIDITPVASTNPRRSSDTDIKMEIRAKDDADAAVIITAMLQTGRVTTLYLRDRASEPGRLLVVALRREG